MHDAVGTIRRFFSISLTLIASEARERLSVDCTALQSHLVVITACRGSIFSDWRASERADIYDFASVDITTVAPERSLILTDDFLLVSVCPQREGKMHSHTCAQRVKSVN